MAIISRLSILDRFLTLWIFLAMAMGIISGFLIPGWAPWIASLQVGSTSIPIAIGLILMMVPPLAKVRYEKMGKTFSNKKLLTLSLVQNWVIGPVFMTLLAVVFLRDQPGYMVGVILVGLARCIAMVVVWNDLAGGHRELGIGLVALNAIFQVLFYGAYIFIFINLFLNAASLVKGINVNVSFWESALTVFIFLGIPFLIGLFSRLILIKAKGQTWFEGTFLKAISPMTLVFLLFTIIVMFALKGAFIVAHPWDVLRVALPFVIYFTGIWIVTLLIARGLGGSYSESTAVAFAAASNDFELAIAVAIALWGVDSPQAFAAVIGPLIEVPVMILLVSLGLKLKDKLWISKDSGKE